MKRHRHVRIMTKNVAKTGRLGVTKNLFWGQHKCCYCLNVLSKYLLWNVWENIFGIWVDHKENPLHVYRVTLMPQYTITLWEDRFIHDVYFKQGNSPLHSVRNDSRNIHVNGHQWSHHHWSPLSSAPSENLNAASAEKASTCKCCKG